MSGDNGAIARTYFRAWKARDFDALRAILADDVTFRGPLGTADGAEECLRGLRGLAQIITDIDVRHVFVDGQDVLTWYDLHTRVAPPAPTANWSHIEDGKITTIRVTFDPREIVGGGPSSLAVGARGPVACRPLPHPGQPAGALGISPSSSSAASGTWDCSRHWSTSASLIGNV